MPNRLKSGLFLLCLLASCHSESHAPRPHGPAVALTTGDTVQLAEVIKGDELEVAKEGGQARVRLLGIQAFTPVMAELEVNQVAKGAEAFLQGLREHPLHLELGTPPKDPHGRYLAYLFEGDRDINKLLLVNGLATVYTEFGFAREAEYLVSEAGARAEHRGLWGSQKTIDLVVGLRKQWATLRRGRGEQLPPDSLMP